jgi:hypothetical protein
MVSIDITCAQTQPHPVPLPRILVAALIALYKESPNHFNNGMVLQVLRILADPKNVN